jgi:hypothetical protein
MMKSGLGNGLVLVFVASLLTACAVRPLPDPRSPAPVRDTPVLLRVCYVDGDGAHLAVGDQVELTTNNLGRLRIRHVPTAGNAQGAWNGGDAAAVKDAVLVELVDTRNKANTRRFVPVGRFGVRLAEIPHARFDFLASKATANLANDRFPECNVELGADEVLIRGVEDDERHGGHAILR